MSQLNGTNNQPARVEGVLVEEPINMSEWNGETRVCEVTVTSKHRSSIITTTLSPLPPDLKKADFFSIEEMQEAHSERLREKRKAQARNATFPKNALSGLLGQWASFMAADSICAPEHYYMSALTFLGHILGERLQLDMGRGRMTIRPQLYTILVGPPQDGKGTVLQNTTRFFEMMPPNFYPRQWGEINSAEGLLARMTQMSGDTKDLIITPDEFNGLLKKSNIDNATLGDMLNTLFEKTAYSSATKSEQVKITGIHLSMLSTIQDDMWDEVGGELSRNGFTSRLMLVKRSSPVPNAPLPPPIDMGHHKEYVDRLAQRLEALPQGYIYPLTDDARRAYTHWHIGMPREEKASRRLESISFRLMLLVAFDLDKREIDAEVMRVVTDLLDWQFAVRKNLAPSQAQNTEGKCAEFILRALSKYGPQTRRELNQKDLDTTYGPSIADRVLRGLESSGEIVLEDAGRRKEYRRVNV